MRLVAKAVVAIAATLTSCAHMNGPGPVATPTAPAPDSPRTDTAHTHTASDSARTADQLQHGMHARHDMVMYSFGSGWMALGMAQVFPAVTINAPSSDGSPLERKGLYATQPAIMANFESPGSRVVLRTTLNFEGITQPGGELTFGGWGEGFLDKRHPHTLLHEAMLSVNVYAARGGGFSLSIGKGFAPYGTDDPMSRPVLKYPTNHHLSQILERWTLNGSWASPRWSAELSVFGGTEPTGPTDFSNASSFADSWSGRVMRRFGTENVGTWPWELSVSFGHVREEHDGEAKVTHLFNAAARHELQHAFGKLYFLGEASLSDPQHDKGFYSILGEARLDRGPHQPYARAEYATRPEYERAGPSGTAAFFRYDHDADPIGATRWLILSAGYGHQLTQSPRSLRPYIEAQYQRVSRERGAISPNALFGRSSFWTVSAGFRVFVGGEPMRMGQYGILDPVTAMHRMMMQMAAAPVTTEHRH